VEVDATFITVAWEAPSTDGGSPVTGYVVEKKDSKRGEYVFVAHVDSTTMQLKVTRLFEGVDYMFRVFAENPAGLSLPCETDKPITAKLPYG
jgi:Fibronectin type III domain